MVNTARSNGITSGKCMVVRDSSLQIRDLKKFRERRKMETNDRVEIGGNIDMESRTFGRRVSGERGLRSRVGISWWWWFL